MGLGNNLKELRVEHKLTQKELAEKLSITVSTLSHWECNYQEPSVKDLIAIANFYGITVDELLCVSDNLGSPTAAPMGESLTASERELIAEFRRLSPYLQGLTLETVRNWSGKTDSATDSVLHKKT